MQIQITKFGARMSALALAAALAGGGLVVTAGSAWATSNCGTAKQDHPTDSSARVAAWSTSLDANKKARGELVRSSIFPNKFTPWFTDDSGKKYYSDYASFAIGTSCEIATV